MVVLPDRPAVDPEERGIAGALPVVRRLEHEAVDRRAVPALEGDLLDGASRTCASQASFWPETLRSSRPRPRTPRWDARSCSRSARSGRPFRPIDPRSPACPPPAARPRRRPPAPGRDGRPGRPPGGRGPTPVGGEGGREHVPVERGGEDTGGPAVHRHHRDLLPAVIEQLRFSALDVGEELAVRTPARRAVAPRGVHVGPGEAGELPRLGAWRGGDEVEVPVVGPVVLRPPAAQECDRRPVGRPRRRLLVVVARGDELRLPPGQGEDVEMVPSAPI